MTVKLNDVQQLLERLDTVFRQQPPGVQEDYSMLKKILTLGMQDTSLLNFLESHPCRAEVRGGSDDGLPLRSWAIATSGQGTLRQAILDLYCAVLEEQKKPEGPSGG